MRIISLNIWGGQIKNPLMRFVQQYKNVDVLCMQEVYSKAKTKACTNDDPVQLDIFGDISDILPDHEPYFVQAIDGYGIGMFVRKTLPLLRKGEHLIHTNPNYVPPGPTHSRKLQWVEVEYNSEIYTIANLHGLWNGQGKSDTEARIIQAQNIKSFLNHATGKKILCGDFNVTPETESIAIVQDGMQNLIRDYDIKSTRTDYYDKPIKYADYFFIDQGIDVRDFQVLGDQVSDHSPLILEI